MSYPPNISSTSSYLPYQAPAGYPPVNANPYPAAPGGSTIPPPLGYPVPSPGGYPAPPPRGYPASPPGEYSHTMPIHTGTHPMGYPTPQSHPGAEPFPQQHRQEPTMGYPQHASSHGSALYTLGQFVADSQPNHASTIAFDVNPRRPGMLQVNLGVAASVGSPLHHVYIKRGSMVAYRGEMKFEREGIMEHGVGLALKKMVTSEGASLTKATIKGSNTTAQLYLADENRKITVLKLQGDSLFVNGTDLLAFEPSLKFKISFMKKLSAIVSGGFFQVKLSGFGCVAILSHGIPLTMAVEKGGMTVYTDPDATVAWSGDLTPDFHTDVQFKTLFGRGSGESFQMKWDPKKGTGFVVVQPYERFAVPNPVQLDIGT